MKKNWSWCFPGRKKKQSPGHFAGMLLYSNWVMGSDATLWVNSNKNKCITSSSLSPSWFADQPSSASEQLKIPTTEQFLNELSSTQDLSSLPLLAIRWALSSILTSLLWVLREFSQAKVKWSKFIKNPIPWDRLKMLLFWDKEKKKCLLLDNEQMNASFSGNWCN